MGAVYHFEGIHSAAASEDGEHIILNVTGPDGDCGLSIPSQAIPQIAIALFEANADARRRLGDRTVQASEIRAMKILTHPEHGKSVLAITIHSGAAPVCFALPERLLIEFARGILERRGQIAVERPSKPQ